MWTVHRQQNAYSLRWWQKKKYKNFNSKQMLRKCEKAKYSVQCNWNKAVL